MNRRVFLKAGAAAAALPIVSSARGLAWMRAPSEVAVDPAALQQLLDESAASLGIVGAQLAVFDGEAVHEFATGLAVRERQQAVTHDTLFQIGSTTQGLQRGRRHGARRRGRTRPRRTRWGATSTARR